MQRCRTTLNTHRKSLLCGLRPVCVCVRLSPVNKQPELSSSLGVLSTSAKMYSFPAESIHTLAHASVHSHTVRARVCSHTVVSAHMLTVKKQLNTYSAHHHLHPCIPMTSNTCAITHTHLPLNSLWPVPLVHFSPWAPIKKLYPTDRLTDCSTV